jgi:hypothetical protein
MEGEAIFLRPEAMMRRRAKELAIDRDELGVKMLLGDGERGLIFDVRWTERLVGLKLGQHRLILFGDGRGVPGVLPWEDGDRKLEGFHKLVAGVAVGEGLKSRLGYVHDVGDGNKQGKGGSNRGKVQREGGFRRKARSEHSDGR